MEMEFQRQFGAHVEQNNPNNLKQEINGLTPHSWGNQSIDYRTLSGSINNTHSGDIVNEIVNQYTDSIQSQRSSHSSTDHVEQQVIISSSISTMTMKSEGYANMLRNFITINDNNHRIHINQIGKLIEQVKIYKQKSLNNLQMYIEFFTVKYSQEYQYLKDLIKQNNKQLVTHDIQNVYINAKVTLQNIHSASQNHIQKVKKLLGSLDHSKDYLEYFYNQSQQIQLSLYRQINSHSNYIAKLITKINQIATSRLNKDTNQDRYLQMKLLKNLQKEYIQQIHYYDILLMKYLKIVICEQQPKTSIILKEHLVNYCFYYGQCYGQQDIFRQAILKLTPQHFEHRLVEQVSKMINKSLENQIKFKLNSSISSVIQWISQQFCNKILLPVIQISDQLYIYQSKVIEKANKVKKSIDLVISSDGYLHLEKEELTTSIKVDKLKIDQRNNGLVICTKTEGIFGYFKKEVQIASIQFENDKDMNQFLNTISSFEKKQ